MKQRNIRPVHSARSRLRPCRWRRRSSLYRGSCAASCP